MNLRFLSHKEIDKSIWDEKIISAHHSRIYATSGWLDLASPGWNALISENYDYIMPLPHKKKFGITYLIQPKFTQQTGIFSDKEISPEIVRLFLEKINQKFLFSALNLNSGNQTNHKNTIKKPNHLLDLSKPYDILRMSFSENTKRNIKKAEKQAIRLHKNLSPENAVSLKSSNNINRLSNSDLNLLKRLILFVEKNYKIKIYGMHNENLELISVSVFSFYNNRVYLPLIASSEEGKRKFASFQIFNTFIKEHAGNNLILDFEGSSLPGVARFFEGWGAKPETYYAYKQNNLPLFLRYFKH